MRRAELDIERLPHVSRTAGYVLENCLFTLSVLYTFYISDFFQYFSPSMLIFIHIFMLFYLIPFLLCSLFFIFFHHPMFSFTFCVSSHCICLTLPYVSASSCCPKPPYLVPKHRLNQQPSVLVVLSYTNRSVNTTGSEELKSLIHEIKPL
jgi:hypothetical protein